MRLAVGAVVLALCLTVAASAAPAKRYAQMPETERVSVITAARAAPALPERLERVSAPFVGTTYAHSPLGEGSGVDADPRLRWDKVDCLTFVETTIALAEAPELSQLMPVLDDIRYGELPPAFNHRNHFVEAQWVPHNVAKGYLRSISREVAGEATATVAKAISPELWKKERRPQGLTLAAKDVPNGTFLLDMVPFAFARKNPEKIPSGTLLMVVRQDKPTAVTRVTHVGFVLDVNGKRVLRHASQTPFARVVDEPFDKFLARNAKYDKWPVDGFALFEIQTPKDRLSKFMADTGP